MKQITEELLEELINLAKDCYNEAFALQGTSKRNDTKLEGILRTIKDGERVLYDEKL